MGNNLTIIPRDVDWPEGKSGADAVVLVYVVHGRHVISPVMSRFTAIVHSIMYKQKGGKAPSYLIRIIPKEPRYDM